MREQSPIDLEWSTLNKLQDEYSINKGRIDNSGSLSPNGSNTTGYMTRLQLEIALGEKMELLKLERRCREEELEKFEEEKSLLNNQLTKTRQDLRTFESNYNKFKLLYEGKDDEIIQLRSSNMILQEKIISLVLIISSN